MLPFLLFSKTGKGSLPNFCCYTKKWRCYHAFLRSMPGFFSVGNDVCSYSLSLELNHLSLESPTFVRSKRLNVDTCLDFFWAPLCHMDTLIKILVHYSSSEELFYEHIFIDISFWDQTVIHPSTISGAWWAGRRSCRILGTLLPPKLSVQRFYDKRVFFYQPCQVFHFSLILLQT